MTTDRVAVVTGSNKGIGLSVVKGLCRNFDGHVYLTSRSEERGLAAVDELKELGLHPKFHQLDIDDPSSIEKLRDFLKINYGGLDILVNNAGIAFKVASTVPFEEQAEQTMYTNFTANYNVCKLLFPLLRPHARVINVSSFAGQLSFGVKGDDLKKEFKSETLTEERLRQLMEQFVQDAKAGNHVAKGWSSSAYAVTKVGLTALTRVLQRQLKADSRKDIIIIAVEPGYVATDMASNEGSLTPDEGADPIVFCCLLPPNADAYKGAYVSQKRQILDWN